MHSIKKNSPKANSGILLMEIIFMLGGMAKKLDMTQLFITCSSACDEANLRQGLRTLNPIAVCSSIETALLHLPWLNSRQVFAFILVPSILLPSLIARGCHPTLMNYSMKASLEASLLCGTNEQWEGAICPVTDLSSWLKEKQTSPGEFPAFIGTCSKL